MIAFRSNNFFELVHPNNYENWILEAIHDEGKEAQDIEYVFVSDEELFQINVEYLNHDTLTDIITFDYGVGNMIAGEIFISTDRVKENADIFDVSFNRELARVLIHGILHLCGYADKEESEISLMRSKEEFYLEKLGRFL